MIISILDGDIVSGETVLLQSMSFEKPIIITRPSTLSDDYVLNAYNGMVVEKTKNNINKVINELCGNEELYASLAQNARRTYVEKHSLYSFGVSIGKLFL